MRIRLHPLIFVPLLCLFLASHQYGQSPAPAVPSPEVSPETGFLSPRKYTNAFFGFSISLPQNAGLHEQTLSLSRAAGDHLLIGFHSPSKGLISFAIRAKEVSRNAEKEARKIAAGPDSSKHEQREIRGKTFWRSESSKKTSYVRTLVFSTAMANYVVEFEVESFNSEIAAEIERNIEQLTFFDPSMAKAEAGADSKPYLPGVSQFSANRIAQLSSGSISGNVYRNEELGFQYEFPRGWVLMSKTQQGETAGAGHQFIWGNSPTAQEEHEATRECSRTLLLVTRYLEVPKSGQFNPVVLLAAADPKCAPGNSFPKAVDDREAIQQIGRQIVQNSKTGVMPSTGPARVRAFSNAGRIVIEVSQSFARATPGRPEPATIFSSILLMQAGDYWVTWMFETDDESELEQLRNTKIVFDAVLATPVGPK